MSRIGLIRDVVAVGGLGFVLIFLTQAVASIVTEMLALVVSWQIGSQTTYDRTDSATSSLNFCLLVSETSSYRSKSEFRADEGCCLFSGSDGAGSSLTFTCIQVQGSIFAFFLAFCLDQYMQKAVTKNATDKIKSEPNKMRTNIMGSWFRDSSPLSGSGLLSVGVDGSYPGF